MSKTATNDNKEELSKTNSETGLWKTEDTKQNFEWFSAGAQPVNITYVDPTDQTKKPVSNGKDYLFVIPQDFSSTADGADKLYVIVEYEINYKSGTPSTISNKVYKQITPKFLQGKAYMLNLTIGRPIEFDVDLTEGVGVEGWGTDEEINIGSGSNDNLWDGIE